MRKLPNYIKIFLYYYQIVANQSSNHGMEIKIYRVSNFISYLWIFLEWYFPTTLLVFYWQVKEYIGPSAAIFLTYIHNTKFVQSCKLKRKSLFKLCSKCEEVPTFSGKNPYIRTEFQNLIMLWYWLQTWNITSNPRRNWLFNHFSRINKRISAPKRKIYFYNFWPIIFYSWKYRDSC